MKAIVSHLRILVARKEMREGRKLSLRTIVAESGASRSAVQRLMSNTIRLVPLDDLALLCAYFGCTVDDVLKVEDVLEK